MAGFDSAHTLSFKLVLWRSRFPCSPLCSLSGCAYCNSRCFAAGVITGAARRSAILSEARGWALKTAWRPSLQGIEGDCWIASNYIALWMEVTLSISSLTLVPVTQHVREKQQPDLSQQQRKRGCGVPTRRISKPGAESHVMIYVICWGRWKHICCINREFLDDFFSPLCP